MYVVGNWRDRETQFATLGEICNGLATQSDTEPFAHRFDWQTFSYYAITTEDMATPEEFFGTIASFVHDFEVTDSSVPCCDLFSPSSNLDLTD